MAVLAFDIGGTSIKTSVFNDDSEIILRKEFDTEANKGGESLIMKLISLSKTFLDEFDIKSIGVSSAGQIDSDTGKVIYATDNIPGWTGIEIKKRMEAELNLKVFVENDVNSAAIGEANFGNGKNEKDFLCLTYGTGIGGAIIINKNIYYGSKKSAAEFGHIRTHSEAGSRSCTCGSTGCYEAYASAKALVKDVKEKTSMNLNGREIFSKLDNEIIKEIVDNWLDEVITGLVSLVYIFNPRLIILGGGVMEQDYSIKYINSKIKNLVMPNYRNVEIKKAVLGNDAGLYGALSLSCSKN